MWPAMTADPMAPGRGLRVYQPATAVVGGTCSAPVLVRPSRTSDVLTPMAGMTSETGSATGAVPCGGAASIGPVGTGSA
jgi:hypothetical protein